MTDETIGQLHDGLAPGESTYRRHAGITWRITRALELAPMELCEVCNKPTSTPPICARCDNADDAAYERRCDV